MNAEDIRQTSPLDVLPEDYLSESDLAAAGQQLAAATQVSIGMHPGTDPVARQTDNRQVIAAVYTTLRNASESNELVTPAGEWLLDNFYLIEENIRQVRRDLPKRFYRQLPAVAAAEGGQHRRMTALADLCLRHSHFEISESRLTSIVRGYQRVLACRIGELWAVPSILRFVLIDELRHLATQIAQRRRLRERANQVADEILLATSASGQQAILVRETAQMAEDAWASQLIYRLSDTAAQVADSVVWIEQTLVQRQTNSTEVLIAEQSRLSAGAIHIASIVRSLRTIDDIDWTEWFASVSTVDAMLSSRGDFAALDFTSQDQYRNAIERLARQSGLEETAVAERAIALADGSPSAGLDACVGHHLIGDGREGFEQSLGCRVPIGTRLRRRWRRFGWLGIAVPVAVLTLAVLVAFYLLLLNSGHSHLRVLLLSVLATLPASEAASGLFNTLVTRVMRPSRLTGFEFRQGVPADCRTLVVVPCLIGSRDAIDDLVRNLEVHYLSNTRGEIHFALVSDWTDAATREVDGDEELHLYAQTEIDRLSTLYASDGVRRFFLLHRRRSFNELEDQWMGWERKRGKLIELNRLLRGATDTSFIDGEVPTGIRFVMTLDSDTRLTRDAVTRLVGKLAHPLNQPRIDASAKRVVYGHAILQPRVTPSLTTGDEASSFQRIFSQNRGLDPYVFTVSDVYQDLTGNGSFTGKGLYDVDALSELLDDRFADNSILSHDLLEGTLARSALVTDVELVEDFPVRYEVETSRQHRWARGDWQLLPLIVGGDRGLTNVGRWKMLDNLRRTLVPAAWVLASVLGWCLMPLAAGLMWQLVLVLSLFVAPTLGVIDGLFYARDEHVLRAHLATVRSDLAAATAQVVLRIAFIAHSAVSMSDAIVRTLYRVFVSRRHLLEWRTAAQVHASGRPRIVDYYRSMVLTVVLSAASLVLTALVNPAMLPVAALLTVLWMLSPLFAWLVSQSAETEDRLDVSDAERRALRVIARRTWRYFETFVTAEHQHLPPDNFQEDPSPVVANRTSPTNIGLYLLSVISARDFAWISLTDTVERLERTLATVEGLEKYRGHLFNWYDTHSCNVLLPRYVSAVDSGNLAGHLIAVSSTCRDWAEATYAYLQAGHGGIADLLEIVAAELSGLPDDRRALRPLRHRLDERIVGLQRAIQSLIHEPEFAPVTITHLATMAEDIEKLAREIDTETGSSKSASLLVWAGKLTASCQLSVEDASLDQAQVDSLRRRLESLRDRSRQLAFDMDFAFLLQPERRLLAIGYQVDSGELDQSCYDLLASEARLASLFAIAKGDLPTEHWFRLGRPIVPVGARGALVSWSGSMFEYLMPPLVMREQPGGILSQTSALAVKRQIAYGRSRRVPWGISEAAFNARDREMTYQYSNFGVPSLGMRRGLADDLVIAPYASLLASQYLPAAALMNLERLRGLGALGEYGFYDAVDFTSARLPEGRRSVVVRNYMAHHHGMSILAVSNVVFQGRLRMRFHSDPVIEAVELLLQEKAPREIPVLTMNEAANDSLVGRAETFAPAHRSIIDPAGTNRELSLLSNGHYSLLLTAVGTGQSNWNGQAVTRWAADATDDQQGTFLFLRDLASGQWWSSTAAPRRAAGESSEAVFSDSRAELHKKVGSLRSQVEVIVASEGDAEGRRLTLFNEGDEERHIEITSYAEPVLSRQDADRAHPAFSKLFLHTEVSADGSVIRARRNRRRHDESLMRAAHLVTGAQQERAVTEAATDRRRFIGRGRRLATAAAFDQGAQLDGVSGFTLDPIFALRRSLKIAPGKQASLIYWTIAAPAADELERAIARLRHPESFDRESIQAWTRSQIQLRYVGMLPEEAVVFQRLASYLVFAQNTLNPQYDRDRVVPQSTLWSLGISGDNPIQVLRIDAEADMEIVRKALRAQEYFRSRGLVTDLVVLNERASSYTQELQNHIEAVCTNARQRDVFAGGAQHIFALRRDQMSSEAHQCLMAMARVSFHARNGKFSTQMERAERVGSTAAKPARVQGRDTHAAPARVREREARTSIVPARSGNAGNPVQADPLEPIPGLQYWNGLGGFDAAAHEYVMRLPRGQSTPHPWINVLANEHFGAHVSAGGASFSWSRNSRDFQLTPWSNDVVIDRPGETWHVVDLESGEIASPQPALGGEQQASFDVRHGLGYSRFDSKAGELQLSLTMLVDTAAPVRLAELCIVNEGRRTRQLRVYHYVEWVLGNDRQKTSPYLATAYESEAEMLSARNPYSIDYADQVAFAACDHALSSITEDRRNVLGEGGVWQPRCVARAALLQEPAGTVVDPCAAMTVDLTLPAGSEQRLLFMLGAADSTGSARELVDRFRQEPFSEVKARVIDRWREFTGVLQVDTPDPAMNLMVNDWLPYQSLACRLQARTAFYQASGAYGFRDQLQDTLAFLVHDPGLARGQILRAAGRQFPEGDVQHWWLPRSGTGVRTTISDDVVWLAYGVAWYVQVTGDEGILDEAVPFLAGPELDPGEHDRMFEPETGGSDTLYMHCVKALTLAIERQGPHGLPLMLGGDWNDGMDRVGEGGVGESVWLGWFLATTLSRFTPLSEARGEHVDATRWQNHLKKLLAALESDGWDGSHYRRAYYDDGTPLGSSVSDECRIDSIAQSWSVMSGLADPAKVATAMDSVLERLVDGEHDLIRLFEPPFEHTDKEPGYIKGYPPGVRENGGQYTHAATWVIIALAKLGRGDDAWACFNRLNPVSHALDESAVERYRVEPYVVAADIYAGSERGGRGGWTWYTGSASWLYRAAVEAILGINREGSTLWVRPELPAAWPGYTARLRIDGAMLDIQVTRDASDGYGVRINGQELAAGEGWRLRS